MGEKKPVKLGIIGCGIAARDLHWPALKKLTSQFEIAGVCNHTKEKAENFARETGEFYKKEIPWFLDYKELLEMKEVEAAVVLLPIELNKEVCFEAAKRGKHILVEKPLAENLSSGKELLALEKQYGELTMMVGENFRYRPVYDALAKALKEGEIGIPFYVEWRCFQNVNPSSNKYAKTAWRINHKYEGGFLTDGGVHNIAALRDIFGDLKPLASKSICVNPAVGRRDTLVYMFETEGREGIPSIRGILNMSFSAVGVSSYNLSVLGSKGTAVIDGSSLHIYKDVDGKNPTVTLNFEGQSGYYEEYVDFYRSLISREPPVSSFTKAYGDLETILNAIEGV